MVLVLNLQSSAFSKKHVETEPEFVGGVTKNEQNLLRH